MTPGGGDSLLDAEMRSKVEDLASRMHARPTDLPELDHIRDDGVPSCWRDADGSWHLTVRERANTLSDRSTRDSDEYLRIVAQSIAEQQSYRLHPPGSPDFRRESWRAQFDSLAAINPLWARAWLTETRDTLVDRGADDAVLGLLPSAD